MEIPLTQPRASSQVVAVDFLEAILPRITAYLMFGHESGRLQEHMPPTDGVCSTDAFY